MAFSDEDEMAPPSAAPEFEPEHDAAPEPEQESEPEFEPEYEAPDQESVAPNRRALDEGVLDVLRQEAERESAARRAEGRTTLESQPDLGLEGGMSAAASGLRERVARLRAASEESVDTAAPRSESGSRRDLLPDIEEINSTLRATSDRQEAAGSGAQVLENDPLPRKRGQFGFGFGIMVMMAALAIAVYVLAPKISMLVPAAKPFLVSYVETVNSLRGPINDSVTSMAEKATRFLTSLAK